MTPQFFSTNNLTTQSLAPCIPWEFVPEPGSAPSLRARQDKLERQAFYRDPSTRWSYYGAFEPTNPNQRISKDNPPKWLHAAIADFDLPLTDADVNSQIEKMPYPPGHVERSLGGNVRLVFPFESSIRVDSLDFAILVQKQLKKWLKLEILAGLDDPALEDPARLYCNGTVWTKTKYGPVPANRLQAFLVKCAEKFNFKSVTEYDIPIDTVERMLREKYPNAAWDGPFEIDSSGPTFWIPESTSPKSAIVKANGIFTFSAHAEKNFYTWVDLLGSDKIAEYRDTSMAEATRNVHFDGRSYHWKQHNYWYAGGEKEFDTYLRTDCNLSDTRKGASASMIDKARRFVQDRQRVHVAVNLVFHAPGVYVLNGSRVLNLYENSHVLKPASEGPAVWGTKDGGFPFLSRYFDTFFDAPGKLQLEHYLYWLKIFYTSALYNQPTKGQVVYIGGGAGVGKNFNDRGIVGMLVGGFADAAEFLMSRTSWNADLFASPLWCLDDETSIVSAEQRELFQNVLKKITANSDFRIQRRFSDEIRAKWYGRAMVTGNLDAASARLIPRLDNSSSDKISLYKAVDEAQVEFGPELEMIKLLERELPSLGRFLVDWNPSPEFMAEWVLHGRFGVRAYHHPDLLAKAYSTSPESTLKELLTEMLERWFESGKETEYRGSAVQICRTLDTDPSNRALMRGMSPGFVDRCLGNIHREGLMPCEHSTSDNRTNVWSFRRDFQKKKV